MDSISPKAGVGLSSLILSIKIIPGSPDDQAPFVIMSKISLAFTFFTHCFVLGWMSSKSLFSSTALINSSVTAIEMLKLFSFDKSSLQCINSKMSGWSILKIPIFAPRLVPPCLTASVAALNTSIKETGPDETPIVECTTSFLGLNLEKEKPVPPPDL